MTVMMKAKANDSDNYNGYVNDIDDNNKSDVSDAENDDSDDKGPSWRNIADETWFVMHNYGECLLMITIYDWWWSMMTDDWWWLMTMV